MLLLIISVTIQAFFSPGGGVRDAIIKELSMAGKKIDVAMYILTDRELSNALALAVEKGVKVRVMMDGEKSDEIRYSKHRFLEGKGIEVRLDETHLSKVGKHQGIMHNKFSIIDSNVLITGSYNWTHSAENLNDENILIVRGSKQITKEYQRKFNSMWARSAPLELKKVPTLDPYNISLLRKHVGEWIVVVGTPSNWNISRGGHLFLDFGRSKDAFTFLMWKEGVEGLKEKGFDFEILNNAVVKLEGKLIDHEKYGLEIVTDNSDAIKIK